MQVYTKFIQANFGYALKVYFVLVLLLLYIVINCIL